MIFIHNKIPPLVLYFYFIIYNLYNIFFLINKDINIFIYYIFLGLSFFKICQKIFFIICIGTSTLFILFYKKNMSIIFFIIFIGDSPLFILFYKKNMSIIFFIIFIGTSTLFILFYKKNMSIIFFIIFIGDSPLFMDSSYFIYHL